MPNVEPLPPEALRNVCDPDRLPFETTNELDKLDDSIGQNRAVRAIHFGIGIRRPGYNMYLLGPSGTGKHTMVDHHLEAKAAEQPVPPDWCYVNNFASPHRPRALQLPPGRGIRLRDDMRNLVTELHSDIPAAFESDDFRTRRKAIEAEFSEREEKELDELRKKAETKGIALIRTPLGLALAPVRDGEVMGPDDFSKLPKEQQKHIEAEHQDLQRELQEILNRIPKWVTEKRDQLRKLSRDVSGFAVGHHIETLRERYRDLPAVIDYVNAVQADILENAEAFLQAGVKQKDVATTLREAEGEEPPFLRRYLVKVLVDHSDLEGAPIVYEDQPAHHNIIGRVEHVSRMGTLVTDFTLVKAGALHRANGGYLVLDARKVLMSPYVWEDLKRTLRSREIKIESVAERLSLVSTVSLEPEPIPLDVKVVLVGERLLYYLLSAHDPDFNELFKVPVDFDEWMDRTPETATEFARLLATLVGNEDLRPLDRTGVARVVEHASRRVANKARLSTHMSSLMDLLRESDFWAAEDGRPVVTAADVQRAIDAQIDRTNRLSDELQEQITSGTVLIDTAGARVGQLNGLSVYQIGGHSFGKPSRITARVHMGKGKLVDIEREVELGGPIHSKGVLILSGFLGGRFGRERPLSLGASLVFEQSYGGVDGDSASSAELYVLLSALAEAPINQALAVTGSVNQHGEVQAVGGVNEKIEGYFDVCKASGLSGEQGVLIPASNVKHLMLRRDVVEAAAAGKFHVYPVETIDQGIEILTGLPAGQRDDAGNYPADTVNERVEARLLFFQEKAREAARPGDVGHES